MKPALYARVSTSNGQQSPEMQVRELREYCERRGWQVAGESEVEAYLKREWHSARAMDKAQKRGIKP